MIRAFQAISTFLLLIGIGFLLYNVMWQFAANGKIKVLTVEELWIFISKPNYESMKAFSESYVSATSWNLFAHSPAAVVLLAVSAIFYLPVRILMLFGFGKKPKGWRE